VLSKNTTPTSPTSPRLVLDLSVVEAGAPYLHTILVPRTLAARPVCQSRASSPAILGDCSDSSACAREEASAVERSNVWWPQFPIRWKGGQRMRVRLPRLLTLGRPRACRAIVPPLALWRPDLIRRGRKEKGRTNPYVGHDDGGRGGAA
jgi:hypothetical protein